MTDAEIVPRKRRRWIGVLIGIAVLLALLVAAWFIGDRIARDYAQSYIREQLLVAFPTSDPVVSLGAGSILAQAIGGSLDEVDVELGVTSFGEISGDLSLSASGVPLDGSKPIEALDIEFDIAEADVQKIITDLDGLENADLSLADGEVALSSSFSVFGATIPLALTFDATGADGQIVLTPATVAVNGAELSLTDLSSGPFGGVVSAIVKPQTVCVAEYLPRALTLTDATVDDDSLTLHIDGAGVALASTDLELLGTC